MTSSCSSSGYVSNGCCSDYGNYDSDDYGHSNYHSNYRSTYRSGYTGASRALAEMSRRDNRITRRENRVVRAANETGDYSALPTLRRNRVAGLAPITIVNARFDRARVNPIQAEATQNGAAVVHWAVTHYTAEDVSAVVRSGAYVNGTATAGHTALHTAAQMGNGTAVMALLVHGANTEADFNGDTPLHLAARHGKTDAVNALLTWGANANAATADGKTALDLATRRGHVDALKALSVRRASSRGVAGARPVTDQERTAAANQIWNLAPETIAEARSDRVRVDRVQAEATRNGAAVVHWAVLHHTARDVGACARAVADVDATATAGHTALHTAAQLGKSKAMMALLVHGANTEAYFNGSTPLHLAANQGKVDAVNTLLTWGAEINATTENRWTALHAAACGGHVSVVEALLARRASTSIRNDDGKTALQVAIYKRHHAVVRTFQEFDS